MNENINKSALFNGSCFALITTAFTFSIRAGVLPQLGEAFGLSAEQLGFINSMWFFGFLISTLFIGIGNGCTEAACNPMIADMYSGVKMQKMLGRFHMWFPGGILVGSLISFFMTKIGFGWQAQMWITMIPTTIYAFLFFGKT